MSSNRFVVMGAGEVGFHLARTLSREGKDVSIIELDSAKCSRVEDELDVLSVLGNGAHPKILEAAGVPTCELFMAVSSSDEANLASSVLAKHLGAKRSVVRVGLSEEAIANRRLYQQVYGVDLLLSTQLLTMTRILNHIRGHNTVAVEYLAGGKVQLRKIHLAEDSLLTRQPLRDIEMPEGTLVVALFRGEELIIPSGDDRPEPGDDALLLGKAETLSDAERTLSRIQKKLGTVVIAGGGATGFAVANALQGVNVQVKIIDRDRRRAEQLAEFFPEYEILHGDATDMSLLRSERVDQAYSFLALTGNDESNLMACLLAQELEVPQELALVQRAETSHLWKRLGLQQVFSPRALANERIHNYIDSGYSANLVSLQHGAAQVMERRLAKASPAAGVTLAELSPPRGLIVGAVVRGERVFVPRGHDRLQVGDLVILFVHEDEIDTVRLLFPGRHKD